MGGVLVPACAPSPAPLAPAGWHLRKPAAQGSPHRVRVSPPHSEGDGVVGGDGGVRAPGRALVSGRDGQMDKQVDRWTSGWRPMEGSLSRATLERMDALLFGRRTDVTADPRHRRDLCVLCCPSPAHRPGGLNSRPVLAQAGSPAACWPAGSFRGREGASFPGLSPAAWAHWPSACPRQPVRSHPRAQAHGGSGCPRHAGLS